MKKFILTLLLTIFTMGAAIAQTEGRQRMTTEQRTEQRIKTLDEKLSLTDTQKTEIRKLYADFNKQQLPREKRREAMEKLTSDIMALLTPEQQTIYKQMIDDGKKEMRKGRNSKQKK